MSRPTPYGVEDGKTDPKGVHAYLSEDGMWIVLFLGKEDDKLEQAELLDSILQSLRIAAREPGPS